MSSVERDRFEDALERQGRTLARDADGILGFGIEEMQDDLVAWHQDRPVVLDGDTTSTKVVTHSDRARRGRLDIVRPDPRRVALDEVRPLPPYHPSDGTDASPALHRVVPYFCRNSVIRAPSSARDAIPSLR